MTLHSYNRCLSALYGQEKLQKVTWSAKASHTGSRLHFTAPDAVKFANMRKCALGYRMPLNGSIVLSLVSPLHNVHFFRLCNRKTNKKKQSSKGQVPDQRASRESSYGCTVSCHCCSHMPNNAFSY